jgi:hypothetical protein
MDGIDRGDGPNHKPPAFRFMKKFAVAFLAMSIVSALSWQFLSWYVHRDDDPPDTFQTWLAPGAPAYPQVLANAEVQIPCIADFERIYPRHWIHIWASFPKRPWTYISCESLVYGRYLVTLSQRVRTNKEDLSVKPLGSPELSVDEITDLEHLPSGGWSTTSTASYHWLSAHDWRRLCEAKGDLAAVIAHLDTHQPLDLAEQYSIERSGQ